MDNDDLGTAVVYGTTLMVANNNAVRGYHSVDAEQLHTLLHSLFILHLHSVLQDRPEEPYRVAVPAGEVLGSMNAVMNLCVP
jgi:hypothetical protein